MSREDHRRYDAMLERLRALEKPEPSGMRFSPKEILVLVIATALAFAGLAIEDILTVFLCLFLSWAAFLYTCSTHPGSKVWRSILGIAITSVFLSMGARLHGKQLEKEQTDTFNHLQVEMFPVQSGKPLDSLFTIKNGGSYGIGKHQIFCIVHKAISEGRSGLVVSPNGASDGEHNTPILPGDAETTKCPLNMFLFSGPLGCVDLTIKISYSLQVQSNEKRDKPFRFVYSLTTGTSAWYQVSVERKESYCDSG
jgi:hypothetical protein